LATLLIPLPSRDFDPTEAAVPWKTLTARGHEVVFATPDGRPAQADLRMLTGEGLGPWKAVLRADEKGRSAHAAMSAASAFRDPLPYGELRQGDFDALLLPGGHAPGMRPYLESAVLQSLVAAAFEAGQPVGAICHGVVLAARSRRPDGRSVLHGRRTTALTRQMELTAWALTGLWLGRYYRTYPMPVQDEVTAALARPEDFQAGPTSLLRDDPAHLERGFVVQDGAYLSARWPGDAHRFADAFALLMAPRR
jgi:putative intracellular protease/amidase